MFDFIDNWIEKKIENRVEKNCEKIIDDQILIFKKSHPEIDPELLRKKINIEIKRLLPMVLESTSKEKLIRAKYTFWTASLAGTLMVGMLTGFSGPVLPFFAPTITALIYWVVTIKLTPMSVEQRLIGGAISTRENFCPPNDEKQQEVNEKQFIINIINDHTPTVVVELESQIEETEQSGQLNATNTSDNLHYPERGFFPTEVQIKNGENKPSTDYSLKLSPTLTH